jgi:hypothetical protein
MRSIHICQELKNRNEYLALTCDRFTMTLRVLIISVLLLPLHGISQTTLFAYQRKSIGEIDSAETFLRSKKQTFNFKISVSPDYLPDLNTSNLANPIYTKE